jgi:hypothetical protein
MDTDTAYPVTVWDVSDLGFERILIRAGEWLRDQGVPQATVDGTYRVEFRMAGGMPFADLFTYAENDQGNRYMDPEMDAPAVNPPFTVALKSLPPDDLRLG